MNIQELQDKSKVLEPDLLQLNLWLEHIKKHSIQFLQEIKEAPSNRIEDKDSHTRPPFSLLQTQAMGFEAALNDMMTRILSSGIDTANGRYLAYIPGGGLPSAAFADYMAALTNRFAGVFNASPGAVGIENEVTQAFLDLFQFPASSWGTLTSGGSLANLTALLAARETRPRSEWDQSPVYITDQCHSSVFRALRMIGLDTSLIRKVATDNAYRMESGALKREIQGDLKKGLKPWMVIASLGTTNTGSIDPIRELVELRNKYGFWLHVDAAYGGFFILTEVFKKMSPDIAQVDSLVLDPHKGLFMPYGCGAVLVRQSHFLKKAFLADAPYLADLANLEDTLQRSPTDYSPELTRHFRAPRIYLSLKTFGIAPFRAALEEKLLLTNYAYLKLKTFHSIEFACEPELSVIAFRLKGEDLHTQNLLNELIKRRRVHLSSTRMNGKFYLRICVLSFRSHLEEIDECIREITSLIL